MEEDIRTRSTTQTHYFLNHRLSQIQKEYMQ